MGEFLDAFKERVNRHEMQKLPVEEANRFIQKFLIGEISLNSYTNLGLKYRLLLCTRSYLSKRLSINPERIKYQVAKLGDETIMGLRRPKGDGVYTIILNEDKVENMRLKAFYLALLHEYGHVLQQELAKNGENMPASIFIDTQALADVKIWQRFGAELQYASNMNEFFAQTFARRTIAWLMRDYRLRNNRGYKTFKTGLTNGLGYCCDSLALQTARILLSGWHTVNKVAKIEEKKLVSLEKVTVSAIDIIQETEEILNPVYTVKSTSQAIDFIENIEESAVNLNETQEFGQKIEYLNAYCYLLADQLGLKREEVSFVLYPNIENFGEFVETRKHDQSCPLFGYVAIDNDLFDELSMQEFVSKVNEIKLSIELREEEINNLSE